VQNQQRQTASGKVVRCGNEPCCRQMFRCLKVVKPRAKPTVLSRAGGKKAVLCLNGQNVVGKGRAYGRHARVNARLRVLKARCAQTRTNACAVNGRGMAAEPEANKEAAPLSQVSVVAWKGAKLYKKPGNAGCYKPENVGCVSKAAQWCGGKFNRHR